MILRRILVVLAVLPIGLAVLAGAAWYWLLYSESGARWAWHQAESATNGALIANTVSGALTPGLRIDGLTYRGEGITVTVDVAEAQVHVGVFPLAIEVGPARVSHSVIEWIGNEGASSDRTGRDPELPVPVSVSDLVISNLAIEGVTGGEEIFIESADLSGTLESFSAAASVTWVSPDLGTVKASVDGTGNLGSFDAADVAISGDAGEITGSAKARWQEGFVLDADLDWESLAWPNPTDPELISQRGDVSVDWSDAGWRIVGDIDLGTPRIPSGTLVVDARGDGNGASVEIIEGRLLGGTIAGTGNYSWRAEQPVTVDVSLENIDVAALEDRVPALVNGEVSISGQLQPMRLSARLGNINGRFKGTDLLANGSVDIDESGIAVDDLRIEHGASYVRLNGWTSDPEGLRFDLSVQDIATYLNEASGPVAASGTVSLNDSRPSAQLDASSASLDYASVRLDDVQVEARLSEQTLSIAVQAAHKDIDVDLFATGELDSWRKPTLWMGSLQRLVIDGGEIKFWASEPASLDVARNQVDIAGLCLTDNEHIQACTDALWSSTRGVEVDVSLAETPVNLINRFYETELEFDQLVTGRLDWQLVDGSSSGDVAITISEGKIVNLARPEIEIITEAGELSFTIVDDDIRAGELVLPMGEFGELAGEFAADDIADRESSAVEGSLSARIYDIGLFAAIFPAIDRAAGSLVADISLSGSVIEPVYAGEVVLDNGSLRYRPIGLRLEEINVSSQLFENGELEVSGQMRVGDGTAQISSRTDLLQAVSGTMDMQLKGENLTIIDVPDIKAIASTELDLGFDGETLSINGRIDVPTAKLTPTNLGSGKVTESEDVIIVAGELPDDVETDRPAIDLRVEGELTVSMGNDVRVSLGIAEADVTGSAVMTWTGDVIPVAKGQFDLSGDILAFGQRLEITEGGIRFPNVSADQPLVRLLAVREIYGNSEIREAGVLVDGELRNPTIEAFTRPATTEERALTLLVTGSDFNYEQGIGAIDFGTYIAPRVFASYGIGLFDQENVVRVRYDLKKGFGITVTSGQVESGIDLSYRFEN